MSFWRDFLKRIAGVATEAVVTDLTGVSLDQAVAEVKAGIDADPTMTEEEKIWAKSGVDLIVVRLRRQAAEIEMLKAELERITNENTLGR